ncbi:DNA starvation/stationary phase protection protein Dps [Acaryochloris marina]|uniref:DNA protection during starvation protein, putative n=1 Tax=Acaryochloris marina (strain MBIC 11017) TaxID=329726 RepID=B0C4S8_ACAM1|nr:DNA starvation/stationary phase protection protein Dps [Acaryochloris marina]ABW31066.1 DNA protection during starvation protein, putative [Acaryochloris marina MBIC11017]BDM79779.1 DNA starvation/stationary phase protection protein [Acaryochloris marina MBIC10699]
MNLNGEVHYYATRLELAPEVQVEIIEILNQTLATTIDLRAKVKCACWNVKGMQFFALYQLFEHLASELDHFADLVGERIVTLGGVAMGTVQVATQRSEIPAYALRVMESKGYVILLAEFVSLYAKSLRASIEIATGLEEANTADLYREISRAVDKMLWMLEAHLQV